MSNTTGFFTNGLPTLDTLAEGTERVPVDTGLDDGRAPQTAGVTFAQVASGVTQLEIPLAGFSIQVAENTNAVVLAPAGTLATGAILLPLAPAQGQELELSSTQTQSALTVTAGAGHTIVGAAVTALVAVSMRKWRFVGTVWYRTQ